MTEAAWLICTEHARMLELLRKKPSDRKLRLCACACSRRITPNPLDDPSILAAVEVAEQFADGLASEHERAEAHELAALTVERTVMDHDFEQAARAAIARNCCLPLAREDDLIWPRPTMGRYDAETCGIIREVFGPLPFRPVVVDPAWLTSTVVQLARGIYDERAFDRLPILADALMDAGCEQEDVLNHCRDRNAAHGRGCWVVDLLLGKE